VGAYQYYDADPVGEGPAIVAHNATSAQDELKRLFATKDSPASQADNIPSKETPAPKKTPAKIDRYAAVTGAPKKSSETPSELPQRKLEKTSAVQSALGNRYATVLTTTQEPPQDQGKMPATQLATGDVARGQEPPSNSLRAASPPKISPDLESPATLGADLVQAPKAQVSNPFALAVSTPNRAETTAFALEQARPLQPAQSSPAGQQPSTLASSRYQAISRPPSTTPTTPQVPHPAPPLAIQSPPQRPLPPFGVAPLDASPQDAPPTDLRASRAHTPPRVAKYDSVAQGLTPTPGLTNHPGTGRPGESLLEGVQSPSITIHKLAPEEIQVGRRCTFAIRVQNNSQRTAQNVQIHDEVPLGTELIGTAPRATVSGSEILWDLGTLSPGEQRTVEMELLPKEEGELGSVARVTLSAQASAKSRCTRPQLALRLTSMPQVHLGQQHVVQIEISNPGSGDATGVMLLETIPAGVSHEAGPALEFEIGTLRAGENRRLELLLTAEQAGKINNVMTARADASLQVEANCEFEILAPELQLSVEGPKRRFLERAATYRVNVDNPGTATAKDVQLVTHLPRGMQFVSANNMGEYDSSSHSVHWSLAELPANERGTVELVALPIEPGTQTLQIATKAQQGLEDHTNKKVLVEGLSALMFEVIGVEGLIEIGGETTYEIRVQNQGSKAATNVQVVVIMDIGIRPVSGQGETRHTIQGERVVFAPLQQLAPKAETTFHVQAQGIRPGDQRVRIQITSDDLQQPITKEVSTRVYADE